MTAEERIRQGHKCPYTDKPCYPMNCSSCDVEADERRYLELLNEELEESEITQQRRNCGYTGIEQDYPISAREVIDITAETGALETARRVKELKPFSTEGYWISYEDDSLLSGKCSVCGWKSHLYEDDVVGMPYCPNCGSRMVRTEIVKNDSR